MEQTVSKEESLPVSDIAPVCTPSALVGHNHLIA